MNSDKTAKILFVFSLVIAAFGYGVGAQRHHLFPMQMINNAAEVAGEFLFPEDDWFTIPTDRTEQVVIHDPKGIMPGLTLISGLAPDRRLRARVVRADGSQVHNWDIDWFDLWPNPEHLAAADIPKERPGTVIHGIVIMSDGDLAFNFERLGLVRLNACGEVVWRFPYRTHHSLELDDNGNFWTGGLIERHDTTGLLPNLMPPYWDYSIVEISPEGKLLQEKFVSKLLADNGLHGLLYMTSGDNWNTAVYGDTLHLNDVEIFPSSLPEGVFSHGDVMISLRNINGIFVFGPDDWKLKFFDVGQVLRQHDPDFIDGNKISIFDNNNLGSGRKGHHSRIVSLSALNHELVESFAGTDEQPFYTDIMGKHQWLANGNILIAETREGRAFEVDRDGKIIWEYFNFVEDGILGLVDGAQRLPPEMDEAFFKRAVAACTPS